MVICLERCADLHMAQLMPLPLTVSCFSKVQIGFTFLVPAYLGSPGQKAVKRVCVCVYSVIILAVCQASSLCHTYTRLMALCPGRPGWAGTRKVKPIWILLKQATVSGSGISWAICKSAPRSRQITMPAPHHSVFYRPVALPAAQPTASKHWRRTSSLCQSSINDFFHCTFHYLCTFTPRSLKKCRWSIKCRWSMKNLQFSTIV